MSADREAPLALRLADAFYAVVLEDLPPAVIEHLKTLILDALACIHAAPEGLVAEARAVAAAGAGSGAGSSHVLTTAEVLTPAAAVVVNGALLRSRDLMDVYAGTDVCHPSEAVPTILAAGEQAGASCRLALETFAAAVMLHVRLSEMLPMHRHGFHHTGHAAIVAPLAIARMRGLTPEAAAAALNLSSAGLLIPEGFSRGHVTNLKTYAYGLQAKAAFGALSMSGAGLHGASTMLDEMISVWSAAGGALPAAERLTARLDPQAIASVWLKRYPAQYALQPLIAAATVFSQKMPGVHRRISEIKIRASRRTVERCADPAKYMPSNAESADHSLPFCVATALVDGSFNESSLEKQRWLNHDVREVMERIRVEALDDCIGYEVGRQMLTIRLKDGEEFTTRPEYPPAGVDWRQIAVRKLVTHAHQTIDVHAALEFVQALQQDILLGSAIESIFVGSTPR